MRRIGITGGIGSGKTLVSRIFSKLGVPVYNADTRARWLMENDEGVRNRIKQQFGEKAYLENGKLNSTWLSSFVFNDPGKLGLLNAIVHPAVGKDFSEWCKSAGSGYILKEAALLYEAGTWKDLDGIIVVTAPRELRIQRVLERDQHRNREQVESIIKRQMPEEEKVKKADFLVVNDEEHLLIPQVLDLHKQLSRHG